MLRNTIHAYGRKWHLYTGYESKLDRPKLGGVYIIRVKNIFSKRVKVAYVGCTGCYRSRIPSHLVLLKIKRSCPDNFIVQVLFKQGGGYFSNTQLERNYISKFQPPFNVKGNRLLRKRNKNWDEINNQRSLLFL